MSDAMRDLRLPQELCEAAEQRFGKRFGKFEDFLVYVLQRLVSEDAEQMDQDEQRIIEDRLKDLGYI
ncbi:MAG TPA: hypothetical protein VFA74_04875 [Terriglobales bacterium]|nr:hypothetical protein [Terriglobales bacterium]